MRLAILLLIEVLRVEGAHRNCNKAKHRHGDQCGNDSFHRQSSLMVEPGAAGSYLGDSRPRCPHPDIANTELSNECQVT